MRVYPIEIFLRLKFSVVYYVIVVVLLAFIAAVCSNEMFQAYINFFMKTFLYLMQRNLTKNDISNIVYKAFLAIISQQVILENTFFIGDLSK